MESFRRALVIASALFMAAPIFSGAGTGPGAASGRPMLAQEEPGQSEIETEIAKSRDVWVAFWNARKINQVLTLYAPDATFLTAGGERATGLFEIHYLFERMRNSNTSDLTLHSLAFAQSGDLAYDSGSYSATILTMRSTAVIWLCTSTSLMADGLSFSTSGPQRRPHMWNLSP
jgi:ketosteroid isomerase-like protein